MVAAKVAVALRILHRVDGLVIAGTPIGKGEFVSANKSWEAICKVVNDLTALLLPSQDQYMILRMSHRCA